MYKVGVDIGGTFTDWVMVDDQGNVSVVKTPTTNDAYGGVLEALGRSGVKGNEIKAFAHGTTLGTNALLQRALPRVAMVTTKDMTGFLTQVARGAKEDVWDIYDESPLPSHVPLRDRFDVEERTLSSGELRTILNEQEARAIAKIIHRRSIRVIAVCFLHSYANPANEQRMAEILVEEIPDAVISTSHETSPRISEYERFTTTILNVGLIPIMAKYVNRLVEGLDEKGYKNDVLIAQSAGGLMGIEQIRSVPVRTANSGPAVGALAAQEYGRLAGFADVIGLDIGGTSTDVSVTQNGKLRTTETWQVEWGHPILFPAVDVITVGSGGGSVSWFDAGGTLRMGPRSMGADPGPACYMKGGNEATITDAHVVLGRLNAEAMLGGTIGIDVRLSENVVLKRVGRVLGLNAEEAANAMIAVAEANMADAIRLATIRRGLDPRDYVLVAFGGAGPLHGARVAKELNIPISIIPPRPGLTSAYGCLLADIRHDLGMSRFFSDSRAADPEELEDAFVDFERRLLDRLDSEDVPLESRRLERHLGMAYAGQWRVLQVPVDGKLTTETIGGCLEQFRAMHLQRFNFSLDERPVEIHGISATAIGVIDKYRPKPTERSRSSADASSITTRNIYWEEAETHLETKVYARNLFRSGSSIEGPAVIEQLDSTTLVPPAMRARVDDYLNLIIDVGNHS